MSCLIVAVIYVFLLSSPRNTSRGRFFGPDGMFFVPLIAPLSIEKDSCYDEV